MVRIALSLAAAAWLFSVAPAIAAQGKKPVDSSQTAAKPESPGATKTTKATPASQTSATVNINTASAAEFEALPGIGPKTAARIVEYRQKNGPFKKVEELMNVRGLGEKNFLKLKGQLTLGAPKTSDQ